MKNCLGKQVKINEQISKDFKDFMISDLHAQIATQLDQLYISINIMNKYGQLIEKDNGNQ